MGKRIIANELTLGQLIKRYKGVDKAYHYVRRKAREVYAEEKTACEVCGYTEHVEICHIKDIAKFTKRAKVKTINARNNIKFLCPNHHWEFDNAQN